MTPDSRTVPQMLAAGMSKAEVIAHIRAELGCSPAYARGVVAQALEGEEGTDAP